MCLKKKSKKIFNQLQNIAHDLHRKRKQRYGGPKLRNHD